MTIHHEIKDLVSKLLEEHPDHGQWDKWARRFLMGIDSTKEASERAFAHNEAKFKLKSGQEPTSDFVFELISEHNAYYVGFIARSCVCRAAIAWADSTNTKGPEALDLAKEARAELGQATNTLAALP